jgi:ABC-2 type transport system permease protein
MNTMKWLLRREYWEHRGSLFLTPLIIAGLMLLLAFASLSHFAVPMDGAGQPVKLQRAVEMFNAMKPLKREWALAAISNVYMLLTAPIFILAAFTFTLFCVNSLYDERKDRSILFWKSLPVSDRATVLSKVLMALVVAPLFSLLVAGLTGLTLLLMFCLYAALHGANLFGIVFSTPGFLLAPLRLIAMLPVYALWALPTVGWLMLVSAWARSKVLAWAVGVPVLAGILLTWSEKIMGMNVDTTWYWTHVAKRILLGFVPGMWHKYTYTQTLPLVDGRPDMGSVLEAAWSTLAAPALWIGVVAACAMLYGAIRLRGARDEG